MAAPLLRAALSTRKTLLTLPNLPSPSLFSTACRKTLNLPPPLAKKVPFSATAHGVTWQDPYHWMCNTNDPDFISYINQENSYADAFMRETLELQNTLYSEMLSRLPPDITTPPHRWGPWLYYQCIPEGKEYPILYRKPAVERKGWIASIFTSSGGGFGREQVLLDWNDIAEKHGYVHVNTCRVSPDHRFLAYTVDTKGDEQFQLQIKDIANDSVLPQPKVTGVVSLAWAQDSSTLFYTLCDQNLRPYRVMCTKLGSHSGDDAVILTENDSCFCLDIASTKDGKFITVNSNSRTSSEVWFINASNPHAGLQRFCRRVSGVQYFLEHHRGIFYVLTNAPTCKDKKFSGIGLYLARCRVEDAQSTNLEDFFIPGDDMCLWDMDIFNGHLVLFLTKNGSASACSINMPIDFDNENEMEIDGLDPWFFPLPSDMCIIKPGLNDDFMNTVYRAVLSSPVIPDFTVDYDMSTRTFSIAHQEDVRNISATDVQGGGSVGWKEWKDIYEKYSRYEEEVTTTDMHKNESVWWKDYSEKYYCTTKEVISHDGVRIPMTILYSRAAYREGQSPGLLHGYGAYGDDLDKSWCPDQLSLLDRGWLLAFADVRGGAGPDCSWHECGRGLNKLNSIQDFVSCAQSLIDDGLIHKDRLSALGVSAGCLLVGAAANMHPQLFRAAILKVPFLDVLSSLLDPSLPLTTLDYEEFGNPQNQSCFEYILKYSPYENIPEGACCPSMLVSAAFNDARVGVWESAKWVAKVRDTTCPSCSSAVILRTSMDEGHFGGGGRFASCREKAFDYAFLIKNTDLQKV
ncbi:dipeptidyl aminopeptidase BI [Salvia hispanica]|uniref:dipeptidyl aminopeptidase BI n=1 Tax=Salvia hispanica TaxID=49212 RepID=UPI0020090D93|nr:dipeptidyl aminopeptidase BI [Salvia hispanica]